MKKGLLVFLSLICLQWIFGCIVTMAIASAMRPIVLVNGTLIDGKGGRPMADAIVIIKGTRIAAVGTRSTLKVPKGSVVIDVRRGTILPGFINSHVHGAYNEYLLRGWAQEGVTTVRDLAAYLPVSSYTLRNTLNSNPVNARLVASGPQMTGGFVPPRYPSSVFVNTPAE